ncbi:MAG: hypothetical protein LBN74_00555 [Prevotella sp.]|jgi:hypothetical protein|nr:hypothetical protein [Prevotella sp.]
MRETTNSIKMKGVKITLIALLLLDIFFISVQSQAQVTIGSGIEPMKGAVLDVKTHVPDAGNLTSASGGIVLPRVRLIDINTLKPFIADEDPDINDLKKSHVGLTVYNLSLTGILVPGLYVWDGQKWMRKKGSIATSVDARNGLSLSNDMLELGGTLTRETVISQVGYNMEFTTGNSGEWRVNANDFVVFGDNSVGIGDDSHPADIRLTAGGNTNMDGKVTVSGNTMLEQDAGIDGILRYDYNGADNSGKYLMAIDNEGTAEWSVPRIGAANTVTGTAVGGSNTAIAYNSTNWYSSNQYINLPPGRWLVKFTFLMKRASNTNNHQKVWVTVGFSRRTTFNSGTTHESYDTYRDRHNPSWPVYVECVLDAHFDYTSVTGDIVIDNTATGGFNNATEKLSRFDLTVIKEGGRLYPQNNPSWNWTSGNLQLNGNASENMLVAIKLD